MNNKNNYEQSQLYKIRHSTEHVLMQAMQQLGFKFHMAMGPAIDDGFYFDFELLEGEITENDFGVIEKKMQEIVDRKLDITKQIVLQEKAKELFKGNPYKLEWIEKFIQEKQELSVYYTGNREDKDSFVDLCSGPHVENTKDIKAFKLLSIAGAYWHGDEKNIMLTRIYGTAFESQQELDQYLEMVEEAKKRDHRKLGKDLGLFVFSDVVGKGLPLWTARGATIRRELERFIVDEEIKRGYQHVITPDIAKIELYEKSGHYPYYKDSMYAPIVDNDEQFMLRPMTCPHHYELYLSEPRSYKDLPMRIAEVAKLYRYEKSGELTGLLRVRSFCLADAHIICADPNQAKQEISGALDLIEDIAQTFGLKMGENYWYRLSLGNREEDKKYFKDDAAWDESEEILRQILKTRKAEYYEAENEAAFYGPKIDVQMKNILGKEDTAFTVQYDFVMPKRFKLTYTGQNGQDKEAIVVHRSSIGAIERIIGFLIEHFSGALPVWLSPEQVNIIPISDEQGDYAKGILERLKENNIRASINSDAETMQNKIRKAQEQKTPYMIIVGKKEVEQNLISVRLRTGENENNIKLEDFIERVVENIKTKSLGL